MSAKLLLVDDAPIIRLKLKNILTSAGFEVVAEAGNGVEALKMYKQHSPDLVTMDIVMPEKDGLGALADILEYDAKAKVIMVTAIDQRDSLTKAIQIGALDYIVKPFENDRVVEAVSKAVSATT